MLAALYLQCLTASVRCTWQLAARSVQLWEQCCTATASAQTVRRWFGIQTWIGSTVIHQLLVLFGGPLPDQRGKCSQPLCRQCTSVLSTPYSAADFAHAQHPAAVTSSAVSCHGMDSDLDPLIPLLMPGQPWALRSPRPSALTIRPGLTCAACLQGCSLGQPSPGWASLPASWPASQPSGSPR